MMISHRIALISDFGLQDPFVGIMKGVISHIAPGCEQIDITHAVPPGDILRGAVFLWQTVPFFPADTIFLGVVDPGVGSDRKPIIASNGSQIFVGPDNGLFTFVLDKPDAIHEIANPSYFAGESTSHTFHGRDIFSPAAAHLSTGVPMDSFGRALAEIVRLPPPLLKVSESGSIEGEILFADRFGNLLTTLGKFTNEGNQLVFSSWLDLRRNPLTMVPPLRLRLPDGQDLPFVSHFSEIPDRTCAALIGSSGLIEIAANRARAVDLLDAGAGDRVEIHPSHL